MFRVLMKKIKAIDYFWLFKLFADMKFSSSFQLTESWLTLLNTHHFTKKYIKNILYEKLIYYYYLLNFRYVIYFHGAFFFIYRVF